MQVLAGKLLFNLSAYGREGPLLGIGKNIGVVLVNG